ncbi:MAG TPA: sugar ABC transporter permease [Acetobacteraceae bacterium]|jgi:multiple sugar transport system permease protein|nr:sugar ABC transporter permease [Acetobacteraceae bacterium]
MRGSRVVTLPAATMRRPRTGGWWTSHQRGLVPYLFIAPNMVLFTAFSFLPLLYAVYISFHDWTLIGEPDFIGIGNYRRLVHDPLFWRALVNTLLYAAGTVPTSMAIGMVLALALNRRVPARVFLRSVYFLPLIVSAVATGTIAAWMFNDNYGVLNAIIVRLGGSRVSWLSSPYWALPSLMLTTLWVRVGFCMVVYLAALQSIPRMYYEAARIDGASALRQFLHVTLPLLKPATFLLLVLSIIYSFHVFDLIYVMTGGGPGFSTTMLVQYIFRSAFVTAEMGYASAVGIALYVLILGFTILQWRTSRQAENVM